jgi:osmotically-inducible protein OsmY
MRSFSLSLTALCLGLTVACGRGETEEATEETPMAEETVPVVADSLIERDVQTRIDDDPRLEVEGVEIAAHSTDQVVTLVGQVPSRFEWSIAREVALSTPGVKTVLLDSLTVMSEQQGEPTGSVAPPQT